MNRPAGTEGAIQTIMKRLFSIAVLCMLFSAACAQSDVTTFLGIPVDGTKPEMIQKLRAKGYTAIPNEEDMVAMLGYI